MTLRELQILAIATAVMLLAAATAVQLNQVERVAGIGEPWLPEFEINDVSSIELIAPGGTPFLSLTRDAYQWRVAERSGYPANLAFIRRLLLGLHEAKRLERKTDQVADFPRLGLRDIADPEAQGHLLVLTMPDGQLKLRLGKQPEGRTATYVRFADAHQCWTINRQFDFSPDIAGWLAPEVMALKREDLRGVRVIHPDGEEVIGTRKSSNPEEPFLAEGLPVGRVLSHEYALSRITQVLTDLEHDDVQSVADAAALRDDATVIRTEVEMVSGFVVVAELFAHATERYVQFRIRMPERMSATGRADATALKQHVEGWVYQIPTFVYDSLTPRWDVLTKPAAGGAEAY